MKTYYTIYKVTNQINSKIYIGSHKTTNLNDNYMGSGKYLNHAINKHGLDKFTKEILFVYDNADEMYAKEAELVNEEFLVEENTYNLRIGGMGGFDYINSTKKNLYGKNGQPGYGAENVLRAGGKNFKPRMIASGRWESHKENLSKSLLEHYKSGQRQPGFKGKVHTNETKRKMSEAAKGKGKNKLNSQYGTMWITNEKTNKKINKNSSMPTGWRRGRITVK